MAVTATIVASGWTGNNDGGGLGLSFTTTGGVTSSQRLLVGVGSSSNADTIGTPGTGTWAQVSVPDNVVTSSGGQFRVYECSDPASSTAYAFTMSSSRRTLGWILVDNEDDSGVSMVDVASSLESAAGATHAPPSVTPTASSELVIDWFFFRQFNPDASTCTPPASGLSWTELLDVRGLDAGGSGQNVQMAVNYATAGASGVAISTAALNTVDTDEPAMAIRVVIKSAAGGTDATAAPAAVAAAATLPAPAVSAGSTPTPAATAATTALPAATISAGSTTTPAAVATTTTLPQATVSAGSTTAPTVVVASAALPPPTVSAGSTATPSAVVAIAALPTVTLSAGSTVSSAPIAAVATLPAAAVSAGVTTAPAAIAAAVSLPAPTVDTAGNATVTPAVIAVTVAVQSVALSAGFTVSPTAVVALATVPAVTVQAGDVARLSSPPIVSSSRRTPVTTSTSPPRLVTTSGRRLV